MRAPQPYVEGARLARAAGRRCPRARHPCRQQPTQRRHRLRGAAAPKAARALQHAGHVDSSTSGVLVLERARVGCVFRNVFVGHILQDAGPQLPPDKQSGLGEHSALLADSLVDLVVLLGIIDEVASKYELFITSINTEIMVAGRPTTLPTFKLSGKELLVSRDADGGLMSRDADGGLMSRDVDVGLMSRDADGGLMSRDVDGGLMSRDADGGLMSRDRCGWWADE
eukprot:364831-Chlamydomonas_euryale.AAC.12